MNTAPTATPKLPAPFAAVVHFKQNYLWQKKHSSWTFRSNDLSPEPSTLDQQYRFLEQFVLKELQGTYLTASVFDNCGLLRIPAYDQQAQKSRNLIWQYEYMKFKIDKRRYLDLSFNGW